MPYFLGPAQCAGQGFSTTIGFTDQKAYRYGAFWCFGEVSLSRTTGKQSRGLRTFRVYGYQACTYPSLELDHTAFGSASPKEFFFFLFSLHSLLFTSAPSFTENIATYRLFSYIFFWNCFYIHFLGQDYCPPPGGI